jgi:hypothetical protein
VLRPNLAFGAYKPGAEAGRGQAGRGSDQGVPQSRCPLRGRRREGHGDRYSPGWHSLSAAQQHRPVVIDDHFAKLWQDGGNYVERARRRRHGLANYRLVRYADDFVVLVSGHRDHAESIKTEMAAVLAPMGLVLSEHKTSVCHIDEGLVFLGFRIQRKTSRGTSRRYVYTYPSATPEIRRSSAGPSVVVPSGII